MKLIFVAALAAVVGGCASMYRNETYGRMCREADWEQLYYDTTIEPYGPSRDRLSILEQVCPYNDTKPDLPAKARAIARVEKEFCQPKKGYDWGRSGKEKPEACRQFDKFNQEWRNGYRDHLTLQLNYLHKDGIYQSTYDRHLGGKTILNTNPVEYIQAQFKAEVKTTEELKIKRLAIKSDRERDQYIRQYSRELDALMRE